MDMGQGTNQTSGQQQGTEIDLSGYDNPYSSFWG